MVAAFAGAGFYFGMASIPPLGDNIYHIIGS
jgi:hypothetical protein